MKYRIEWDYTDNNMVWKMQIQDTDNSDFKDFIMYWMPWLIQDLFDKFGNSLKEKAKEENISYDKIISVMSLMSVMCQNSLSEKLTTSLNEFLADDPVQEVEEDTEEGSVEIKNNWSSLLWNNQDNKC